MNQVMKWAILAGASAAVLVYESVRQRLTILNQILSQRDDCLRVEAVEPDLSAAERLPAQTKRLAG